MYELSVIAMVYPVTTLLPAAAAITDMLLLLQQKAPQVHGLLLLFQTSCSATDGCSTCNRHAVVAKSSTNTWHAQALKPTRYATHATEK